MTLPEERKTAILDHERDQARKLASEVIFRPQLSIWMILIPVIFVYYFYRLQRYAQGNRDFIRNYLQPREDALEAACAALAADRNPDIGPLIPRDHLPKEAVKPYGAWLRLLTEHYTDLLKSEGKGADGCIRKAYGNRTNYLLFLNRLKKAEADLNKALLPNLTAENSDVPETVKQIEECNERLRRQEAGRIFP